MWFLLILAFIVQGLGLQQPASSTVKRLPLQKKKIVLKSPTSYAKRILRVDEKTGEPVEYDPKPRVMLLDAKSGKYALKWIGYDGQEKTVVYQRPDAIDAVVSASVSRNAAGKYLYTYIVHNLASSGEQLGGFAVQNFTSDLKPLQISDVYVGPMSKNSEMMEGNWIRFGIFTTFTPPVNPGTRMEFRIESSAPPGMVECRINGGALGMKGVGEDMPQELENVLPGYEAWPSGYTIGPVDNLLTLSTTERKNYLVKLLPKFKELGWITTDTLRWYQQNVTRDELGEVYNRVGRDFSEGSITSEVVAMIRAITNR